MCEGFGSRRARANYRFCIVVGQHGGHGVIVGMGLFMSVFGFVIFMENVYYGEKNNTLDAMARMVTCAAWLPVQLAV